jgi:DNA-binding TFAR19-related protein (PDSD5 family)
MYLSLYQVMKIKTVKPEKAMGIENSLINAARSGLIKNRLTEAELVNLLEKDNERKVEQKITVNLN